MHLWSEHPLQDIWARLRYLESPANVFNLLSGKTRSNREPFLETPALRSRSREIASAIRQADEYARAAEAVSLSTQPLLVFYSIQSLAKAIVLASNEHLSLADLRYHGLSSRPSTAADPERTALRAYSEDATLWALELEFAVTNDGVFPQLSLAAGDHLTPSRSVLRFREMVRMLPDMAEIYSRHYGEASYALPLYDSAVRRDEHIEFYFEPELTVSHVLEAFPEFRDSFVEVPHRHGPRWVGFRSREPMTTPPADLFYIQDGAIAGRYLSRPHPSGVRSSLGAIYAAAFILGNVVRYKPAFWMEILEGDATGVAAIAEAFVNTSRRRFPNDTLQSIWRERFTYGGPAYLS